jgi:hypothetical protein
MVALLNGNEVERRRMARTALAYPVRIGWPDGSQTPGQLRNISQHGAGLSVTSEESLPDEFHILLSYDNAGKRACRKIWQTERDVGVEFLQVAGVERSPSRVLRV